VGGGEDADMRAFEAKVSGRSDESCAGEGWVGCCAGFAAREEALAKGLEELENGFDPLLEKGFSGLEPFEGLVPKREEPRSTCGFCGAGSGCTGAGAGAGALLGRLLALVALNPLIVPSFLLHTFFRHPSR